MLRLGVEPVEVADPPDRLAEHLRPGSRYSAECRAVARERSTIPDARATIHDAMLDVDEVITCSYGCGDLARPGPGGNQVAVLARSQTREGGQGQAGETRWVPRLGVSRCYRLGGARPEGVSVGHEVD